MLKIEICNKDGRVKCDMKGSVLDLLSEFITMMAKVYNVFSENGCGEVFYESVKGAFVKGSFQYNHVFGDENIFMDKLKDKKKVDGRDGREAAKADENADFDIDKESEKLKALKECLDAVRNLQKSNGSGIGEDGNGESK